MMRILFSWAKNCTSSRKPLVILTCFLFVLFCLCTIVHCSPPEDPIKCSANNSQCSITNSYGTFPDRSTCRAATAVFPSSEEELIAAVATGTKNKMKMKVATRYSHSIPKLVCPDGEEGLLISTKNLNKILKVDTGSGTMTVQSGVTLRQLIEEAAKAGLALPYSPYWWGVTTGGMLGTGAHGSSLWGKGSAVHDYVVELRIVSPGGPEDGYVRIQALNETHADLQAAKVSLGVLGVISQVTLKLEPLFKRSITYVTKDDHDLGDEALMFGTQHEFADITWYPSQHKAVYRIDDRVPPLTPGNGLYDFSGFRSTLSLVLAAVRSLEEGQESRRDAKGKCLTAIATTSIINALAFGLTNDEPLINEETSLSFENSIYTNVLTKYSSVKTGIIFTGYPVVGYQNRTQASGTCLDNLYNGILMRYVKASPAYLGKEEDGIDFDITYYRSKDPLVPRLYEDVLEEIEQMAMFKYGGSPHWGKNRNLAFEGVIKKYKNGVEFLRVKERFDPLGLFSSQWTNKVLGLDEGVSIVKDGCALEGLCICSQDSHCAPSQGYFCRPGRIYKEAGVCRRDESTT
ncbi:hypothetical protein Cgig2_022274 [Carnegiea gigantea]|uniref:L-gulonolactone oxidase n=1 Tax=Carnegiea gigantea TaxID=171969 RepID=A0A9Q1KHF4_9CARY|nr:hypothetical protein Cgig2_022274 [Carnegiea gigantea]